MARRLEHAGALWNRSTGASLNTGAGFAAWLAALAVLGVLSTPGFKAVLLIILPLSIYAMAYGVLLGYANQPSLGQAVFFGLGAYCALLSFTRLQIDFWLALGLGMAMGAVGGAIAAVLVARMNLAYHVIVTALFGSIASLAAQELTPLTGGTGGMSATIPRASFFGLDVNLYSQDQSYVLFACFAIASYLLLQRLVRSPIGKQWEAIRENESRLRSVGINTLGPKVAAYAVSSALTALAGALYAIDQRYASSNYFDIKWSVLPFLWVLIGGSGTIIGPVLGVTVYEIFEFYVSQLWANYLIILGILILVVLRWGSRGIIGYVDFLWRFVGLRVANPRRDEAA
jgi:branched-chain amino acid transport system permease protein